MIDVGVKFDSKLPVNIGEILLCHLLVVSENAGVKIGQTIYTFKLSRNRFIR